MKIKLKKGRVVKMFSNRVEAEKIFKKMDFENIKDFFILLSNHVLLTLIFLIQYLQ